MEAFYQQTKEFDKIFQPRPSIGKKTLIPSSCAFLPFSFLLHWKNAILLIIKVKAMADLAGRSYMYLPVHVLLQPCPKHHNLPSLGTKFYLNTNRLLNNMCFTGQHFVPFFSCPDKKNNAEKKLIGGIKRPLILPVFCTRFRNFLYLLVPLTPPVLDQLYLFRL